MSLLVNRAVKVLSIAALLVSSAFAYATPPAVNTHPKISVSPKARIMDKVDVTKVTVVANSHPEHRLSGAQDMGRAAANTPMNHMMLVMKSTDEQEFALHSLLDEQQDKNHPNYHQWVTPESFGEYFGVEKSDIAKVTAWLKDSGFIVDKVAKGGRIITFSGTSAQVEAAFNTEIHNYVTANGDVRFSNSKDFSIPTALTPVVLGPEALNNFPYKRDAKALRVTVDPTTGKVISAVPWTDSPNTSTPTSTTFPNGEFVGGADLATIYDTNPLFAQGIQGQGVTLGIIGQTDVLLSDIQIYRSIFGLPVNNYTRVQIGTDPGIIADDTESDLDLEVSGAMAPLANQIFYTSGNSDVGGGVDSSVEYVIEDNAADIFSMSYGECEGDLGAGGNAFYAFVYEQGAAQGQSFFISSGDDGPDTCGAYYSTAASASTAGYTVNGLGSTPYNVSVGGTQFNEGASYNTPGATQYWSGYNTAIPYESAKSFVPDEVWNESKFGTNTYGGFTGGGSGISFYYGTPSWQVGPGVPTTDPNPPAGSLPEATIPSSAFVVPGPHRYMPDVALNAAVYHDGTVLCSEGSCTLTASGALYEFGIVGGTSVASPTMAGAQALINQMNGGRQGVPNYYYYRAAAVETGAGTTTTPCIASAYVATAGCSFHDSQIYQNDVPGSRTVTTDEIGWNGGPGFDLTVGLDSPDVYNLATNWSAVNFNATKTTMTISPTTGSASDTYNISVTVTPAGAPGTPTGDVGIIAQQIYGGLGWITLSGGTGTGSFSDLPGGTYCIYAHYGGDTNFGGSSSPCTTVTIATITPTVAAAAYEIANNYTLTPTTLFPYATNVYIQAGLIDPGANYGTPSGTISFALTPTGGTALPVYTTGVDPNGFQINGVGQFYDGGAYYDAGLGIAGDDIAFSGFVLAPGTWTANISYSGDTTYYAASATPFSFVVGAATQTIRVTAGTPDISTGGVYTLYATMATLDPLNGGVPAVGTVTFTDTTTGTVLGTAAMVAAANGSVTFSCTATPCNILTTGAHAITGTFAGATGGVVGGATYYGPATSTAATITVITGTAPTLAVNAQTGTIPVVLGTASISATVTTATSGTVTFFDSISGVPVEIGTGTTGTTHIATLNIATLIAGTHPITAVYGGTTTVPAAATATGVTVPYVINKNTPTIGLSSQVNGNIGSGYAFNVVLTLATLPTRAPTPPVTGSVSYMDAANGGAATSLGTSTLAFLPNYEQYDTNFTSGAVVPGYHVFSAVYSGDNNYATVTSNTLSVAVGITTLAVSVPVNPVGAGELFTVVGTVSPVLATSTQVGGTVTFYNGAILPANILGTGSVVNGVATGTVRAPTAIGAFTISAAYSGDTNFYKSTTSSTISVTTIAPAFTISVPPGTVTVAHGTSGPLVVTGTVVGNWTGSAALSCSDLPAYTTCTFVPQPLVFDGADGAHYASLVITTSGTIGAVSTRTSSFYAGLLWLPAMMLAGLLALGRKKLTVRGRQLMVLAVLLCGIMATNGCSSSTTSNTTPTGSSTVTVTATGVGATSASPNISPTTTFNLVIQ